jgi:hypothetical protein
VAINQHEAIQKFIEVSFLWRGFCYARE